MQRLFALGLFLIFAVPLLAQADRLGEDRKLLEKWREDPAHYARLQHDLAVFQRWPAERQQQARKLEHDLEEENPAMRARLARVLARYADWLDRLSEADRQHIEQAPDRKTKLERIRAIRQGQWVSRLPRAQQEQIKKTPEKDRAELVHRLRREQAESRAEWQIIQRHGEILRHEEPAPVRLSMLPADAQKTITENLLPLLSKAEQRRLRDAEGKWPGYMRTLVELADSHPLSVLGPIGPTGPNSPKDMPQLPSGLKQLLTGTKSSKALNNLRKRLDEADGRWPEAGVALRDWAHRSKKPVWQLDSRFTPSRAHQFPPVVQQFLEKRLVPALDEQERIHLKNAEGHWPAYPRLLVELAGKHNLTLPTDKGLPGRFEFWDKYRTRCVTAPAETFNPLALSP